MKEKLCWQTFTFLLMSALLSGSLFADGKNDQMKFIALKDFRFSEIEIQSGLPEIVDRSKIGSPSDALTEFGWFQYGDGSSRAVCIMFDPRLPNKLLVDINRDRKFSAGEQFESENEGVWFVDLTAEYGQQQNETSNQLVRIRHDTASAKWLLATAGFRKGKIEFNGELREAKLEDKNANGLWFDREDRLFVDFDGDRKISRLTERIPAQGMRKIRGDVYAIAGSPSGQEVSLSEVNGSGYLNPTIELLEESATVTSVSGLLGSNTGIGIPIESIDDEKIEVPPGDWHIENLRIEVTGKDGVFVFAFARSGNEKLVSVADGETHKLELLGELSLSAGVSVQHENEKSHLTLTPILTTESGCYLVDSKTGKQSANIENRVVAYNISPQGDLKTGSSGFS